ncbi:MAG: type II toxin-antitoxin system Phd/YefM family antitoxin [Thermomicrobiales bacterium]|nr:type II toxin-antitoxin system Phd/YefM family antitoxin [Thermomicrobiales bacterium]MCO5220718.1 type II toxin-antitoxin system Phd/YefM family antitoxin [Thermomicrobiales bacterium]
MVNRTVSATEAKNRFGAVVKSAREEVDAVLVENHGEPYVFLVSPAEYQRLQESDNELRRRKRLEQLEEIMRIQAELNKDLTPEAAEELVQRAIEEDRIERRRRAEQGRVA